MKARSQACLPATSFQKIQYSAVEKARAEEQSVSNRKINIVTGDSVSRSQKKRETWREMRESSEEIER